jgi:AraC family transcriptional regulator
MALMVHTLAAGEGWWVGDIGCNAGPADRSFEERHEAMSIAAVTAGSFQYRSSSGRALLMPGALLLGNHGTCYECSHEHAAGDHCLSFQFSSEYLEGIIAATPGVRRMTFARPNLPPLPQLLPIIASAEALREQPEGLEELAPTLAAAVASLLADTKPTERSPSKRDERRATSALRRIEGESDQRLSLAMLAREAAMSPYHFLRVFRQVVGLTPHQFLLRTRLHRAALRLIRSQDPVSTIALDAGFNDLSTFNHRFRRYMGMSPGAYRAGVRTR